MAKPSNVTSESSKVTQTTCYKKIKYFLSGTVAKESRYCWLLVGISLLVHCLVFGFLNIFGVFYVQLIREFGRNDAKIAWVGSSAYGMLLLFGPFATKIKDKLGTRVTIASGSLLCFISILSTSFAPNINVLFPSFSLIYGVGGSCITMCTSTLSPFYFTKHMPIAAGIVSSGSSIGTLIFSFGAQSLIGRIGWRNTWRFFSGLIAVIFMLAIFFKPVKEGGESGLDIANSDDLPSNVRLWKNRVFIIWVIVVSMVMFGTFVPFVHIVNYANQTGIPPELGSTLISIMGGSAAIGKLSFGKIIEIGLIDRLQMHQLAMVVTGTCTMLLPTMKTYGTLVVYSVVVGFVSSCHTVLLPVLTSSFVGTRRMSLAFGMLNCVSSVFHMMGPPVAGWLYEYNGNYDFAFHVCAIPVLLSSIILFLIPWAQKTTFISLKPPEDYSIHIPSSPYVDEAIQLRIRERLEHKLKNLHLEIEVPAPIVSVSMPDHAVDAGLERQAALQEIRQNARPRHMSMQEVDRKYIINVCKLTNKSDQLLMCLDSQTLSINNDKIDTSVFQRSATPPTNYKTKSPQSKLQIIFASDFTTKIPLLSTEYIATQLWHSAEKEKPESMKMIKPWFSITLNKTSVSHGFCYQRRSWHKPLNVIYESQFELDDDIPLRITRSSPISSAEPIIHADVSKSENMMDSNTETVLSDNDDSVDKHSSVCREMLGNNVVAITDRVELHYADESNNDQDVIRYIMEHIIQNIEHNQTEIEDQPKHRYTNNSELATAKHYGINTAIKTFPVPYVSPIIDTHVEYGEEMKVNENSMQDKSLRSKISGYAQVTEESIDLDIDGDMNTSGAENDRNSKEQHIEPKTSGSE